MEPVTKLHLHLLCNRLKQFCKFCTLAEGKKYLSKNCIVFLIQFAGPSSKTILRKKILKQLETLNIITMVMKTSFVGIIE